MNKKSCLFAYVRAGLQRIDCVHEARRGWDDKGVHVLDADDGLSIKDLAPSEVKSRVMTYCERCLLRLPPFPPLKLARVCQCGPCCEQIALKTQGSACAHTTPSCALLLKPYKGTAEHSTSKPCAIFCQLLLPLSLPAPRARPATRVRTHHGLYG